MCQVLIFEEEVKKLVFDLDNALASTNGADIDKNSLPKNVFSRLMQKSVFDSATSKCIELKTLLIVYTIFKTNFSFKEIIIGKTNLLSQEELDKFFDLFQR